MIKKLKGGINSCLTTERTRLARTTLLFIQELSTCLGDGFDQLADIFFPTIIKLTTRANKVYVSSASQTLKICIENSGASSTIPLFLEQLKNPSKTARIASVEALVLILSNNTPQDLEQFVDLIENAISTAVVDSSVEVRDLARQVFEQYRVSFEQRTEKFWV
ncbi:clasp N-terminal domain-containing protein, partial [Gorgonomyces haynaldii]